MSYYPQTIAKKMEKGLTKEIEMYAAISKALREDGNSKSQVSYYMSVDEDFIPDVLQVYNEKENTMNEKIWIGRDEDGRAFKFNAPTDAGSTWVFTHADEMLRLFGWSACSVVMQMDSTLIDTVADLRDAPYLNPVA